VKSAMYVRLFTTAWRFLLDENRSNHLSPSDRAEKKKKARRQVKMFAIIVDATAQTNRSTSSIARTP